MIPPRRRGACPSLAVPMQTGDGLLARLTPTGATIPLDAIASLCAAARRHGSGIIEVTSRGSIQVRGLTPRSAPVFIDAVAAIDIEVADGVPVAVNPLAGLESSEAIDARALAAALREAIGSAGLRGRLAPKVSVAIDSGGMLHLDQLAADLRLRADAQGDGTCVRILLGGNAERAVPIGTVAPDDAVEAAIRLLTEIATRGREARAREIIRLVGTAPFRSVLADILLPGGTAPVSAQRPCAEPIGLRPLRDGDTALGLGLAFGHTDADALERLAEAAMRARASGVRTAPDRALLVIGIAPEQADDLVAIAGTLGFAVRAGDPRRSVAACPGAPLCPCSDMPIRALAPGIAAAAASILDGSITLHLSGCGKGCAHQGPAALAVVGGDEGCGVVVNATARDRPLVMLAPEALRARFTQLAQICAAERLAGEDAAAILSRLGPARIAAIMAEGTHA